MTPADRYGSIDDLALGDEVWTYARGWWRRARVLATARRRACVGFRLVGLNARDGACRIQWVALDRLRRDSYEPAGPVAKVTAPTAAEVKAWLERAGEGRGR